MQIQLICFIIIFLFTNRGFGMFVNLKLPPIIIYVVLFILLLLIRIFAL